MIDVLIWTIAIGYLMRAAYTAGVIKAWLMWEGKAVDPISLAWAGATWPMVVWRGWRARHGR